ncbi:MAG: serine/threonine-protein kinase, partial [Nannocystaceae bacterium]
MTSSEHFETIVDGAPGADAERLEASALRPGTHVGRYLVLEPIGEGGMAAVHLAHDPQLHRNVAIKVLHARPGADQARLVREAQALAKLSHPNLVQVYDVGTWGEQVFVAMEYVKGPSLQHWLNRRRSWREVVQCLRAAGEGLVAAHEAGLVHRDFKPGNVLLGDDGRVRVADFGLARLGADPQEREVSTRGDEVAPGDALQTAMTESGVAMGTPAYMAPEQHVAGPVDARCDQFAFCVTLYEGVYGRRPFAVPRRDALLLAKLDGPPAMPSDAKVPSWLRRVIGRGLAPAPEARFESMPALLRAIDEGLFRARRRLGAAGLLAALGITAGLGYAASGSRTQTRCETEPSPIWDEPSRAAVERAFVDTGVALGNDALQLVSARLDVYDDQWRTMHRDACEATHLRGEQSDELLDLRMACLRRRGTQMRATVQVLMEADAEVVENAVEAVAKLPSVEVCADLDALRAIVPLPEAADDRREVEQLEDRLADAYASLNAGRFAPAAEAAEQVAEGARALGYAPLLAEALITQA